MTELHIGGIEPILSEPIPGIVSVAEDFEGNIHCVSTSGIIYNVSNKEA